MLILTKRETRFYQKAKQVSKASTRKKAKIGAIIVIGNYIVSDGVSREKTHPIQYRYDRMMDYHSHRGNLHAEIDALISSGRTDLTGADVYVYREDKNGDIANCRPCVSCTQALKDAGIKHVYYTTREGYNYERWD